KDASLAICREYAGKHACVRVFDQPNGGPSAARNTALGHAAGDYVAFVDSDDTVEPGAFQRMLGAIGDAEMLIAHFNYIINDKPVDRGLVKETVILTREEMLHKLAMKPGSYYYGALWNKLYARRLIEENRIRFDTFFNWAEDLEFNMHCYRNARHVAFLKEPVYNYRRAVRGQSYRALLDVNHSILIKSRLYKALKEMYKACGMYERYRPYIFRYIFNVTLSE
ncbi:MAG TPA: glycosyltransferase, partial [Candidatus Limnocylindria bacterium]|nr:glycosyltransferase [Candidatus Limnocylindria bacterium]